MENELGHIDENLLVKYLAGETTAAENKQFEDWLQDGENRKEFESLKSLWEETGEVIPLPEVDVDMAWNKVEERIATPAEEPVVRHINEKRFADRAGINWFLRIAAVVLPLAIATLTIWQYTVRNGRGEMMAWDTGNETEYRILPDGSKVTLAANSHFEYPEKFGSKRRRIILEGEAFFEVKRDMSRPFIVHTTEADVRVLGTKFNVNTREDNSATEVVVETGKVAFYLSDKTKKQYVELRKGEKALLNKTEEKIVKSEAIEVGYFSHKTKTLVFEKTEMSTVVEVLNSIFGTKILLMNQDIGHCRLTATFQDQDIETILGVIGDTFGLEIKYGIDATSIEGKGCDVEQEG